MADDFFDAIEAAIGENDPPTTVKSWLNTGSPLLNDAISGKYHGGLPVGRMVEMFGPASCGKTAISTMAMIAAQRAGGVAMFLDHENSFDHGLAEGLGLDRSTRWVFKTPDTFEQSIAIAARAATTIRDKKLIPADAPIIAVFDSLASMVPQSKFEKGVEDYNMNDKLALPAATSAAFPALAKMAEMRQFTPLFLNQIRDNVSGYGERHTTPGGKAPEFFASVRISLSRTKKVDKTTKVVDGQTIEANILKNKVHRPFERAAWDFVFTPEGNGKFDAVGSVVDHLKKLGVLATSGAYIVWDGKKLYRNDLVERIYASGDVMPLYSMLPGWEAEVNDFGTNGIDWNATL